MILFFGNQAVAQPEGTGMQMLLFLSGTWWLKLHIGLIQRHL